MCDYSYKLNNKARKFGVLCTCVLERICNELHQK